MHASSLPPLFLREARERQATRKAGSRLYGRDRRRGRPDRAGEPQRRGGEQEAVAPVGAQPVGERGETPELPQVDPELEQAMLVEGELRAAAIARAGRVRFDRVVVGDQAGEPA